MRFPSADRAQTGRRDPGELAQDAANALTAGDREGALRLVDQGLALRPSYPPLLSLKAVVLVELGRGAEGAPAMARAAAAAAPDWPDGQANLGYVLQAIGDTAEAEKAYRTALARAPKHLIAKMNLANLLMREGRGDEALTLYRQAAKADPGNRQVRFNLALALKQSGDSEGALNAFRALFSAAPDQVEAANHAAALLLDRHDAEAALQLLDRALAARPDHARTHNNRGSALRMLCRPADALDAYRQAARLAPEVAETWRNIGLLAAELGLLEEAAQALRGTLARAPGDAIARHTLDAVEGRTTGAPPGDYVARNFDAFAPVFDRQLVEELGYRAPAALAELADRLAPDRRFERALDLGCGTGLVAEAFGTRAATWTGVDLSGGMLALCQRKGRYARLAQTDVTHYLQACGEVFDLITAADVLIYLGDLTAFFAALPGALAPGGLVLLSTERANPEEGDCKLRTSGRYAHADATVERAAAAAGLTLLAREDQVLRHEQGLPMAGSVFAFAITSA